MDKKPAVLQLALLLPGMPAYLLLGARKGVMQRYIPEKGLPKAPGSHRQVLIRRILEGISQGLSANKGVPREERAQRRPIEGWNEPSNLAWFSGITHLVHLAGDDSQYQAPSFEKQLFPEHAVHVVKINIFSRILDRH